jgi:urease accessory protein UreH
VGNNATLYYVPHPVVPHNGSTLLSESEIFLKESSRLVFADILTVAVNILENYFNMHPLQIEYLFIAQAG